MRNLRSSEEAKNAAVSKTKFLIALGFGVALFITFVTPHLSTMLYSNLSNQNEIEKEQTETEKEQTEAEKDIISRLSQIALALFWLWFSPKMIESTVVEAIKTAEKEGSQAYEAENPNVEKIREQQAREYVCSIPLDQQSEDSVKREPSICANRLGRDAVIRSLAYNEKLMTAITAGSTEQILKMHKSGRTASEHSQLSRIFEKDIYIYIKAWLIMSITHDCIMPISYIRPKYPTPLHPDKKAYIAALSKTRKIVLSPNFYELINDQLKEDEHAKAAIKVLDQYLDELVELLKEEMHS